MSEFHFPDDDGPMPDPNYSPTSPMIRRTTHTGLENLDDVAKANGWNEILYDVREEQQRRMIGQETEDR